MGQSAINPTRSMASGIQISSSHARRKPIMKTLIKNLLYQWPSLLANLMRMKSNWNRDKYVFLKIIEKGNIVLDVGGNIGDYCCTFAKVVGSSGQVHSFEPVPSTFDRLKSTIVSEGLNNVILNEVAVSNESGEIEVHMPGDDHARPSIQKHTRESWDKNEPVHSFPCKCTTIDDYIQANSIASVDFLKIDVEGAEHLVLQGAKRLLKNQGPILFFEMWDSYMRDFGSTVKDFSELLNEAGYDRFLVIQEDLKPLQDLEQNLNLHLDSGILNLVCGKVATHTRQFSAIKT